MAGAYESYVQDIFKPAKQAMTAQIGQEKAAGASKTQQMNLAGGVTGPAATALVNRNQRLIGQQGNMNLMNLDTQQRQARYQAFSQDRAEQIQSEQAKNQQFLSGLSGVGSILGGLAGMPWMGALASWAGNGINLALNQGNINDYENQARAYDSQQYATVPKI